MDDLDKAYEAAKIFVKHKHKGQTCWCIERTVIQKFVVGQPDFRILFKDDRASIEERLCVHTYPFRMISYEVNDAWAIAQSLEKTENFSDEDPPTSALA